MSADSIVIILLVVMAVGLWLATHFVTTAFGRTQDALSRRWFRTGQAELASGKVQDAILSLQTALTYSRENYQYRLRLGQALVQAGRLRQANGYLLAMWDQQPGNGTVNLELARIAAQTGDFQQALRFYHGAIYGLWDDNPEARRRDVRLELIPYLLRNNAKEQAQSELIATAADLPRDPSLRLRVADLFARSGEYRRSLEEYQGVLSQQPRNATALLGAGEAGFQLEQYQLAERYLRRAVAEQPDNTQAKELLEVSAAVRNLNPYLPRLSVRERARRVVASYRQAEKRSHECAEKRGEDLKATQPETELQTTYAHLEQARSLARPSVLIRNFDNADAVMDAVGSVEQVTSRLCGAPAGEDRALMLIIAQQEGSER